MSYKIGRALGLPFATGIQVVVMGEFLDMALTVRRSNSANLGAALDRRPPLALVPKRHASDKNDMHREWK